MAETVTTHNPIERAQQLTIELFNGGDLSELDQTPRELEILDELNASIFSTEYDIHAQSAITRPAISPRHLTELKRPALLEEPFITGTPIRFDTRPTQQLNTTRMVGSGTLRTLCLELEGVTCIATGNRMPDDRVLLVAPLAIDFMQKR